MAGPLWYAQYNNDDKLVVCAAFLTNPTDFVDDTHSVTVGFDGDIPQLVNPDFTWAYWYNEDTQELEPNIGS